MGLAFGPKQNHTEVVYVKILSYWYLIFLHVFYQSGPQSQFYEKHRWKDNKYRIHDLIEMILLIYTNILWNMNTVLIMFDLYVTVSFCAFEGAD